MTPDATPLPEPRASDADRERTVEILNRAAADGRLTVEELEERTQTAYATRTRGELERLVADVPVEPAHAAPSDRPVVREGPGGTSWIVSIMGGNDRRGRWRIAERCTVLNVMGGSDLDLSNAEFADQTIQLNVFSLMGGADIRVPEGAHVQVSKFAFMGGHDLRLGDGVPPPDAPLIRMRLVSIMGGCDVRRGPKRSRKDRRRDRDLPEAEERRALDA